MSRLFIAVAPERIADAKRLYELTSTSVGDIAAIVGLSRSTLRRRIREWGWVPRYAPRLATIREEVSSPPGDTAETGDGLSLSSPTPEHAAALAAYYQRTVERGLDQVNRILDRNGPADAAGTERSARVLSSLFRTLRDMTAVLPPKETASQDEADDEPAPRTIDEFRDALADQIERILQAHRNRSGGSQGGLACGDDCAGQAE